MAGSLGGGEEALIGTFVELGLGMALGEADGIPHLAEALSLLDIVMLGHGLGKASGHMGMWDEYDLAALWGSWS